MPTPSHSRATMGPSNELYTAFSFIGFVLCANPFQWHLEAWNTGTCMYMAWAGLGCLIQCINSIVWNKNTIDKAPVYCDISTRIQIALTVAIPACMVAINRRLYKIVTATAMPTRAEKRRAVITDLLIGLGIPILEIIAHVVVSGHRYNLWEDFGPYPSVVNMVPSYFLVFGWPVAINAISLVYVVMTIYASYKRRFRFKEIMSCNPGLDRVHYINLVALSVHIPVIIMTDTIYLVRDIRFGHFSPWVSWADTHSNYSRVDHIAGFMWKNDPEFALRFETVRWSLVAYAFRIFFSLGFIRRTRQNYRHAFTSLANRFNHMTSSGAP